MYSEYDVNCDYVQTSKGMPAFERTMLFPFSDICRSVAQNVIIDGIIAK
jgi:hypothetical protein